MSVVSAATEDQVDACDPSCHWKSCRSPQTMRLLAAVGKEASFAVVSMTVNS